MVTSIRPQKNTTTILLAANQSQSVLAEVTQRDVNRMAYSVYGHLSADRQPSTRLGFNGEHREQHIHWYLLGNGYRVYNPVLTRFHSPDKLSPFGAGGLNPYMYCTGDPINYRDPTGHFGVPALLSQLIGVGGGTSSLGGMVLALSSSGRFSGQGVLALGTGALGVLLGAAASANPASVIAPILAGSSVVAGATSMTLAYRAARAAAARGTQWFQDVARTFDRPPRYSTLSLDAPPPSFSSLSLAPPYSPPRVRSAIASTHTTARVSPAPIESLVQSSVSARDQEALLNRPMLARTRMRDLPRLQHVNETKFVGKKIRTSS
jgi:RHS repeat-associated protein